MNLPMEILSPELQRTAEVTVLHDRVPHRLRLSIPLIKHKATFAAVLKQTLLGDPEFRGIYHVEPNELTGSLIIKFHTALHTQQEVIALVEQSVGKLADGSTVIMLKHKNPRLGRMKPGAYFSRELMVSIAGNVIAGLVLALFVVT